MQDRPVLMKMCEVKMYVMVNSGVILEGLPEFFFGIGLSGLDIGDIKDT